MKRSTKTMWIVLTVVAFIAIVAGGTTMYRIWQRPPIPLADIPAYPYEKFQMRGASLPIDSVDPAVRTRAEQALTQFASTVESGYVVAGNRFLAGRGGFTWDAVRSEAGGYLQRAGYSADRAGQTPEREIDFAYILWRRDSKFWRPTSSDRILAVALQEPVTPGSIDEQVHIYGYFRLTPAH
ncbi:hypothetical protein [Mycobacterium sp. SMC-17]|uniref:hypothetical protein n=1 Tax=Mycobacterium sp. SMC-17 TaxID=3381628 RepID=UPI003875F13E